MRGTWPLGAAGRLRRDASKETDRGLDAGDCVKVKVVKVGLEGKSWAGAESRAREDNPSSA